jgi:predicted metal-dependent hydrolase
MVARLNLGGVAIDVAFKDIKNVHLSVNPPHGRVRISAPRRMRLDTVRVFAISKVGWIKQQQRKLQEQDREPRRNIWTGKATTFGESVIFSRFPKAKIRQ